MTLESILLPSNADNSLISTTEEKVRNDLRDEQTNIDFKMVTFSLSEKDYAIDITNVKEIVRASNFTFVPNVLPFVVGVYNLRGDIIPIIDMKLFFNMGNSSTVTEKTLSDVKVQASANVSTAEEKNTEGEKKEGAPAAKKSQKSLLKSLVIITLEDQTFGIIVDSIDKVVGVQKSTIRPPHPLFSDVNIKYISGVVESNKRLYILLDIERIFSKNSSDNALRPKDKPAAAPSKAVVDTPVTQHEGNAREAGTPGSDASKSAGTDEESHPAPPPPPVAAPPKPAAPKKSAKDLQRALEEKVLGPKAKNESETESAPPPPPKKVEVPPVEKAPPAPSVSEAVAESEGVDPTSDPLWPPLIESLKKFSDFSVSSANEAWVKFRFGEWKKAHGGVEITSEGMAKDFLSSFWSPDTGTWWTKEYAEAVYNVLPDISGAQIVAWNPGCGGGPESFCLACVLTKRYPSSKIRVYAQDKDLLAVSNAPMVDLPSDLSSSWLSDYLSKTAKGKLTFNKSVKDSIMFEYHDCLHTNMLAMCDIIFARDLVSVIDSEQQENVLSDFNEKLKNNGVLFIGENEDLEDMSQFIESTVGELTIYKKQ